MFQNAPGGESRRGPSGPPPPGALAKRSRPLTESDGVTPCCPRCRRDLLGAVHGTGIAWRCEHCGGESLNYSQFRKLIPEQHANEIWLTAMEHPVVPRCPADCPECRRSMTAVLIPFQGREIELAVCRNCQRLWMENQENQRLRIDPEVTGSVRKPPVVTVKGRGVASGRSTVATRARRSRSGGGVGDSSWMAFGFALLVLMLVLFGRYWLRN